MNTHAAQARADAIKDRRTIEGAIHPAHSLAVAMYEAEEHRAARRAFVALTVARLRGVR